MAYRRKAQRRNAKNVRREALKDARRKARKGAQGESLSVTIDKVVMDNWGDTLIMVNMITMTMT